MGIRLNKAMTMLNIGFETDVVFLMSKPRLGVVEGLTPNSKISDLQFEALQKKFANDNQIKIDSQLESIKRKEKSVQPSIRMEIDLVKVHFASLKYKQHTITYRIKKKQAFVLNDERLSKLLTPQIICSYFKETKTLIRLDRINNTFTFADTEILQRIVNLSSQLESGMTIKTMNENHHSRFYWEHERSRPCSQMRPEKLWKKKEVTKKTKEFPVNSSNVSGSKTSSAISNYDGRYTRQEDFHVKLVERTANLCIDNIEFHDGTYLVWAMTNGYKNKKISPLKVADSYAYKCLHFVHKRLSDKFPKDIQIVFFGIRIKH